MRSATFPIRESCAQSRMAANVHCATPGRGVAARMLRPSPAISTQPSATRPCDKLSEIILDLTLKSLVEQITNTGQLVRGSKLRVSPAKQLHRRLRHFFLARPNDFSCAVRGTLALTVNLEKSNPTKVRDAPPTVRERQVRPPEQGAGLSILFIASVSSNGASPRQGSSRRFRRPI